MSNSIGQKDKKSPLKDSDELRKPSKLEPAKVKGKGKIIKRAKDVSAFEDEEDDFGLLPDDEKILNDFEQLYEAEEEDDDEEEDF